MELASTDQPPGTDLMQSTSTDRVPDRTYMARAYHCDGYVLASSSECTSGFVIAVRGEHVQNAESV